MRKNEEGAAGKARAYEPASAAQSGGATDTDAGTTSVDIEVVRTEIEQTRSDMGETLDAIKDKLNPQALMSQAKDTVQEVTANVAEQAKSTIHDVTEQAKSTLHDVTSDVVEQTKTTVHAVVTDVADHAKETARGAVSGAVGGAVDEAKEAVGSAVHSAKEAVGGVVDTAREKGSSLMDIVKANPVPATLIGLGLGWLYLNHRNKQASPFPERSMASFRTRGYESTDYRTGYGGSGTGSYTGESGSRVGEVADQIKDKAGRAAERVGDAVDTAKDKVGDVVESARDKAGDLAYAARDKASDVVESARGAGSSLLDLIERNPWPAAATGLGLTWFYLNNRNQERAERVQGWARDYENRDVDRSENGGLSRAASDLGTSVTDKARGVASGAREMATGLPDTFQRNPLAFGVVALGLGTAAGLLVPETEPENRLMGQARDRLVEKAQETAGDLKMKAQIVAEETMDAAKQEAKNQGLTSSG
uniref:Late embryogenesis abundant protein n=1 Tax=uncultured Armatimonadetes bacterium TaxID=157466 RepID=A0A6J4HHV4_9BACT|nr:hypothetical protein AVDCRST_MAG63-536 [uncultured Armatimonadetes bacterium]